MKSFAALLALTLSYATFRYHVFSESDWTLFPLWTGNKAISWTAVSLYALAYLVEDKRQARRLGLLGFGLMIWHCLVSLVLLDPAHYAKFYEHSSLKTAALASLALGGAGALAFCLPAWASMAQSKQKLGQERWLTWQRMGYAGLALTALHCLLIGWQGWLAPLSWPGGLPPITLMGFLTALLPFVRMVRRRV